MTEAQIEQMTERCFTRGNPPDPEPCPFCGKMLPHRALPNETEWAFYSPFPEPCDCEQAVHEREEAEREEAEAKERAVREEKQRRWYELRRLCIDPGVLTGKAKTTTLGDYRTDTRMQTQALADVRRWYEVAEDMEKTGYGLYIWGTNGTGKTMLAAALAGDLVRDKGWRTVMIKTSAELLGDIRKAFDQDGPPEDSVKSLYRTARLLIVDDFGKENATQWAISVFFELLNDRYERGLPTIVTSNYSLDKLITRLTCGADDEHARAIVSRFREKMLEVPMCGEDYRTGGVA